MALGTIYPLKVTIIAAVGVMVGVIAAVMGFSAERRRITVSHPLSHVPFHHNLIFEQPPENKRSMSNLWDSLLFLVSI